MLVRSHPDGQLTRCMTPPAWRGLWETKTGRRRTVLVCEDHRDELDLDDVELLGCA